MPSWRRTKPFPLLVCAAAVLAAWLAVVSLPFLPLSGQRHHQLNQANVKLEANASVPPPVLHKGNATLQRERRRPIVYVYDWFAHCHAIKLCAAPTLQASRAAACAENDANMKLFQCSPDPFGAPSPHLAPPSRGYEIRNTHQFAISVLYDARLLASKWRTMNPEEAELFYIPFDPVADNALGRSAYSRAKVAWLNKTVTSSPWYARREGKDHFLVLALCKQYLGWHGTFVDRHLNWATKLTIENQGALLPLAPSPRQNLLLEQRCMLTRVRALQCSRTGDWTC